MYSLFFFLNRDVGLGGTEAHFSQERECKHRLHIAASLKVSFTNPIMNLENPTFLLFKGGGRGAFPVACDISSQVPGGRAKQISAREDFQSLQTGS